MKELDREMTEMIPVSEIEDEIHGWDASLHDPHRFKYFKKGTWKQHKENVLFAIEVLKGLQEKSIPAVSDTMKVYLIIRNDSDCTFVESVFINKNKAKEYIKTLPPQHDKFEIEEWEIKDYS